MAGPNLTSGDRLRLYQALFRMNRSYHLILCRLQELRGFRIFPARRLSELRGLTQEVQLEINFPSAGTTQRN